MRTHKSRRISSSHVWLNYICKDLSSKEGRVHMFWRLGHGQFFVGLSFNPCWLLLWLWAITWHCSASVFTTYSMETAYCRTIVRIRVLWVSVQCQCLPHNRSWKNGSCCYYDVVFCHLFSSCVLHRFIPYTNAINKCTSHCWQLQLPPIIKEWHHPFPDEGERVLWTILIPCRKRNNFETENYFEMGVPITMKISIYGLLPYATCTYLP